MSEDNIETAEILIMACEEFRDNWMETIDEKIEEAKNADDADDKSNVLDEINGLLQELCNNAQVLRERIKKAL